MEFEQIEISRRKALAALGVIGAGSGGAGLGTQAFFSDQETFQNNQLTAGELDMKVAWQAHYSDWLGDETHYGEMPADGETPDIRLPPGSDQPDGQPIELVFTDPTPGDEGGADSRPDTADGGRQFLRNTKQSDVNGGFFGGPASLCGSGADVPSDTALFELTDVKPGDFGFGLFRFELCDNPGFVWLNGGLEQASENGVVEPESDDLEEDQNEDGTLKSGTGSPTVELLDEIQVAYAVGTMDDLSESSPDSNLFPEPDSDTEVTEPTGQLSLREFLNRLSTGVGLPIAGDIPANEAGGVGRNCFSGQTGHYISVVWWLPIDHGNQVQTDSVSFDLGFYTEQCRHNTGAGVDQASPNTITVDFNPSQAGEPVSANLPATKTGKESGFVYEWVEITPKKADPFSLTITHDNTIPIGLPTLAIGDRTYLSVSQFDHPTLPDSDIEAVKIRFKIRKELLNDFSASPDEVYLFRFTGTDWEGNPLKLIQESVDAYVFEADFAGLSPITGIVTPRSVQLDNDISGPNIQDVDAIPVNTDEANVQSTIVDTESGISSVELRYQGGSNQPTQSVSMSNVSGNLYESTIPISGSFGIGDNVRTQVVAEDNDGNQTISDNYSLLSSIEPESFPYVNTHRVYLAYNGIEILIDREQVSSDRFVINLEIDKNDVYRLNGAGFSNLIFNYPADKVELVGNPRLGIDGAEPITLEAALFLIDLLSAISGSPAVTYREAMIELGITLAQEVFVDWATSFLSVNEPPEFRETKLENISSFKYDFDYPSPITEFDRVIFRAVFRVKDGVRSGAVTIIPNLHGYLQLFENNPSIVILLPYEYRRQITVPLNRPELEFEFNTVNDSDTPDNTVQLTWEASHPNPPEDGIGDVVLDIGPLPEDWTVVDADPRTTGSNLNWDPTNLRLSADLGRTANNAEMGVDLTLAIPSNEAFGTYDIPATVTVAGISAGSMTATAGVENPEFETSTVSDADAPGNTVQLEWVASDPDPSRDGVDDAVLDIGPLPEDWTVVEVDHNGDWDPDELRLSRDLGSTPNNAQLRVMLRLAIPPDEAFGTYDIPAQVTVAGLDAGSMTATAGVEDPELETSTVGDADAPGNTVQLTWRAQDPDPSRDGVDDAVLDIGPLPDGWSVIAEEIVYGGDWNSDELRLSRDLGATPNSAQLHVTLTLAIPSDEAFGTYEIPAQVTVAGIEAGSMTATAEVKHIQMDTTTLDDADVPGNTVELTWTAVPSEIIPHEIGRDGIDNAVLDIGDLPDGWTVVNSEQRGGVENINWDSDTFRYSADLGVSNSNSTLSVTLQVAIPADASFGTYEIPANVTIAGFDAGSMTATAEIKEIQMDTFTQGDTAAPGDTVKLSWTAVPSEIIPHEIGRDGIDGVALDIGQLPSGWTIVNSETSGGVENINWDLGDLRYEADIGVSNSNSTLSVTLTLAIPASESSGIYSIPAEVTIRGFDAGSMIATAEVSSST